MFVSPGRFWRGRRPSLAGGLLDVEAARDLDDDSPVVPRPATPPWVERDDVHLRLVLPDRTVTLPAAVEPAVRRLLAGPATPADLDDLLDAPGRLVLVRRLVREGLLTVEPR